MCYTWQKTKFSNKIPTYLTIDVHGQNKQLGKVSIRHNTESSIEKQQSLVRWNFAHYLNDIIRCEQAKSEIFTFFSVLEEWGGRFIFISQSSAGGCADRFMFKIFDNFVNVFWRFWEFLCVFFLVKFLMCLFGPIPSSTALKIKLRRLPRIWPLNKICD